MEGKFSQILKQAFQLTKSYRYFWVLGLFLVWPNLFRSLVLVFNSGSIMNIPAFQNASVQQAQVEPGKTWLGILLILVMGAFLVTYFRSKAVLISSIKYLRNYSALDRRAAAEQAEPHTIELLKLGVSILVTILLVAGLFVTPVTYLGMNDYSARALTLGLMAAFIFVPMFLVLYYVSILAPMLVVIQNVSVRDGIRIAFDAVRKYWPSLVWFSIILFGIELFSLGLSICVGLVVIYPFVFLSQLSYNLGGSSAQHAVEVLAAISGFAVFFLFQALIAVFERIAWTIAFFEIIRPAKAEEAVEEAAVPEAIVGE